MSGSRLREVARSAAANGNAQPPVEGDELCELCREPLGPRHGHLLNLDNRELMCTCRACSLLFDRKAAGGGHFRLVPDRRLRIEDFEVDPVMWAELRIPVDMAFFFTDSAADRVVAYYPGPMGATESLLELPAWEALERANPVLASLEPDVEALLVNHSRGAEQHFIVPIEDCYRLAGLIRMHWRGLTGGQEVWREIDGFYEKLARDARAATSERQEATWER
jgi:hypothetical protein